MIEQLLWAILLTGLTVVIHAAYSVHLIRQLKRHHNPNQHTSHAKGLGVYTLIHSVILLSLLHCAETTLWALFYVYKQGFPDFSTALYFSIVSYATIGYGDVLLPVSLRLVGAIEGIVGTLMAGWSVALLVGVIQLILRILLNGDKIPENKNL